MEEKERQTTQAKLLLHTSSTSKVANRLFRIHVSIIRRTQLDLANVLGEQVFLIANGFDKHLFGAQTRRGQRLDDMLSSVHGRVGSVKGGHAHAILLHVIDEISQSRVARHATSRASFGIVRAVPVGGHLRAAELSTVVAHVEDLTGNVVEKGQEATNAFGNVCLA